MLSVALSSIYSSSNIFYARNKRIIKYLSDLRVLWGI